MKETLINHQIESENVRVIGLDGKQLGIIPTVKAIRMAKNRKVDLVLISPEANPPVARLVSYNKFKYEQQKKEKELNKKQKANIIETKEVRISLNIEDNDMKTKAKNASKFLAKGNKVKVTLKLKGRENNLINRAGEVMDKFLSFIESEFNIDSRKTEGGIITVILSVK